MARRDGGGTVFNRPLSPATVCVPHSSCVSCSMCLSLGLFVVLTVLVTGIFLPRCRDTGRVTQALEARSPVNTLELYIIRTVNILQNNSSLKLIQ